MLKTLDRTHNPERLPRVTAWARDAGLEFSVDLIYGTPGETIADWRTSVEAALALNPGHISAYALTIEPGTKMGAQVRRGELPTVDPDDQAAKYELADDAFEAAGLHWYEISNWAKHLELRSRHKLATGRTSTGGDRPRRPLPHRRQPVLERQTPRPYAAQVSAGRPLIAETEELTAEQIADERVLLGIRMREGLPLAEAEQAKLLDSFAAASRAEGRNSRHATTHPERRLLADLVALELLT